MHRSQPRGWKAGSGRLREAWDITLVTQISTRASVLTTFTGSRTAEPNQRLRPGYAFLFFYGLERRLLVEQRDRDPIVREVVRLIETYPTSGSLDESLSRFLAFVLARRR